MRAPVTRAGHDDRIAQQARGALAEVVARRHLEHELRLQVLGEREIEEAVERVLPALGGELGDGATDPRAVRRVAHPLDRDHVPHEDEGAPRGIGELAPHALAHGRLEEAARARRGWQRQGLAEARQLVEEEGRAEGQVRAEPVGGEHGMDARALAPRLVREGEARLPAVGAGGEERREGLDLERAPGGAVAGEEELAVGGVHALDEAARDDLDRAVPELGEHPGEGHHLVGRRMVRGHPAAVVRHVNVELRGGEAERALAQGGAHEVLHGRHLGRGRAPLRGGLAHHAAAHGRVPDVAAGVHAQPALDAPPEVAEGAARPAEARRQRRARHALDA